MIDSLVVTKVNRDIKGNAVSAKLCFFNERGEEALSVIIEAVHLQDISLEKVPVEVKIVKKE